MCTIASLAFKLNPGGVSVGDEGRGSMRRGAWLGRCCGLGVLLVLLAENLNMAGDLLSRANLASLLEDELCNELIAPYSTRGSKERLS